jgi:hypothetical protein
MTDCLPNRHEVHDSLAPTLNEDELEDESHCYDLGNKTNRTLRYLNATCIPCTAFKRVTVREMDRNKLLQLAFFSAFKFTRYSHF